MNNVFTWSSFVLLKSFVVKKCVSGQALLLNPVQVGTHFIGCLPQPLPVRAARGVVGKRRSRRRPEG